MLASPRNQLPSLSHTQIDQEFPQARNAPVNKLHLRGRGLRTQLVGQTVIGMIYNNPKTQALMPLKSENVCLI